PKVIRHRLGNRPVGPGGQNEASPRFMLVPQPVQEVVAIGQSLGTKSGVRRDGLLEGRLAGEKRPQDGRPSGGADNQTQAGFVQRVAA
ncbi:MAG: hypothetical protein RJA48_1769, partial [Verrucomicrobiota bacterium]